MAYMPQQQAIEYIAKMRMQLVELAPNHPVLEKKNMSYWDTIAVYERALIKLCTEAKK